MKKIFFTFLIIFFLTPFSSFAGDNCTILMQNFKNSSQQASKEVQDKIQVCNAFCEKIPNLPQARDFCGLDDCKVQAAQGSPSGWCCKMAKVWKSKLGVKVNPLESLLDQCGGSSAEPEDFLGCTRDFSMTNTLSEDCCRKIDEIQKFAPDIASAASSYCSQKRSVQVCKAEFSKDMRMNKACCAYAQANDYKFVGTREFYDDDATANMLQARIEECEDTLTKNNPMLDSCLDFYDKLHRFDASCCKAFYEGDLIPSFEGIDYKALDRYCFPENY